MSAQNKLLQLMQRSTPLSAKVLEMVKENEQKKELQKALPEKRIERRETRTSEDSRVEQKNENSM